MPLIGDVDKYMAGGTAVTALYAGTVKVWPLAPPLPGRTASWRQDANGKLHFIIEGGADFPPASTTFTVAVVPFTGTLAHGNYTLGTNGIAPNPEMYWHNTGFGDLVMAITPTAYNGGVVTNTAATTGWGGRTIRVTADGSSRATLIEVLP
jgi:hypothetical protein